MEELVSTMEMHAKHIMKMTSKIMHDWLPAVMHMRVHITGIQQCYNCPHDDEKLPH
jgi:hypothetical protein